MNKLKREVRIFISSTFNDMMGEREHLMKVVFPELRRRCRARFVEVTEIDLRWGISEEDSSNGKVIEICLHEIDKSRPYFIGILGNRYGWIPSTETFEKQKFILEKYPWAQQDIEQGVSITEMEIQYGVLRNHKMDGNAFFYFKSNEPSDSEDGKPAEKLRKLKDRIKNDGNYPVRMYTGIEMLGSFILDDLWRQISADFPEEDIPDAHGLEKLLQAGFRESHSTFFTDYINLKHETEQLLTARQHVLVYSGRGMGKSALLANVNNPTADTLYFACGISAQSSTPAQLAFYIARELKSSFSISYNIPGKVDHPADLLSAFLNAVPADNNLLLIIDGADHLITDGESARLHWLPDDLPDHVKVLISSSEESHREILLKKGFGIVTLEPLPANAIQAIAVNYLGHFSKKLPLNLLETVSAFPLASYPLILFTLLHELRIFGSHDQLSRHLATFAGTQNSSDFFDTFLQRLEADYPDEIYNLRQLLSSLALSGNGLTEAEIVKIHEIPPIRWSQIYNVLDFHLISKGGKISFSNLLLRDAILKRFASSDRDRAIRLEPMLSYFKAAFNRQKKNASPGEPDRVLEELPQIALQTNNVELLSQMIGNVPALLVLFEKHNETLPKYLGIVRQHFSIPDLLTQALEDFELEHPDAQEALKAAFIAGHLIANHDSPASAIPLLSRALKTFNQTGANSIYLIETLKELAGLYHQTGNTSTSAAILEGLLPYQQNDDVADTLDQLAVHYRQLGNHAVAELLLMDTIDYYTHRYGHKSLRLAIQYNNLGRLYDVIKNADEAEYYYNKAADIIYDLLGPEHSLYQKIRSNTGILLMAAHKLDEALEIFESVLQIRLQLYGKMHRLSLKTLNSKGVCLSLMGRSSEAIDYLNQAYEGQLELLGPSHNDTLITLSNIADYYQGMGEIDQAESVYRDVLSRNIEAYGETNEQTINCALGLADTLTKNAKVQAAVDMYGFAIQAQSAFYGENHSWTRFSKFKQAALKHEHGLSDANDMATLIEWKLNTARNLTETSDNETIAAAFEEIYHLIASHLQGNHPAIFEVLDTLAGVNHRLMEYEKAAFYCRELSQLTTRVMSATHPAVLEFRILEAFNYYKAGMRSDVFPILVEMADFHEQLMQFPKQYIANMYREMLGFFNELRICIEKQESGEAAFNETINNALSLTDAAVEQYQKENNTEAIRLLDEAIVFSEKLNHEYAEPFARPFNFKATIYEQTEDYPNALKSIDEGLRHITTWKSELDQSTFFFYKMGGEVLMLMNDLSKAMEYLSMAVKVNRRAQDYPNTGTVDLNITWVSWHLECEHFDKAIQLLEESIPLSQKLYGPHHGHTEWLMNMRSEMNNLN